MNDVISIIIPIYNKEQYLNKCLGSIVNQTYANLEIILINDESTDNSLKICEDFAKDDKRISIINQKNKGESESRNIGIKYSSGKYICFVDGDDFIDNNFIETLYNGIKDTDISSAGYTQDFINKIEIYDSIIGKYSRNNLLKELLSNTHIRCFATKLYKSSIIKDNNIYFDKKYTVGPDYLFLITYLSYCNYCYCSNNSFYHVVMSNDSAMRSSTKYNYRKADVIDIFKYGKKIYYQNNISGYDEYILFWCGGLFNDFCRYKNIDKEYIKKCTIPIRDILNINKKLDMKYYYKILFHALAKFPVLMYHIIYGFHKFIK